MLQVQLSPFAISFDFNFLVEALIDDLKTHLDFHGISDEKDKVLGGDPRVSASEFVIENHFTFLHGRPLHAHLYCNNPLVDRACTYASICPMLTMSSHYPFIGFKSPSTKIVSVCFVALDLEIRL